MLFVLFSLVFGDQYKYTLAVEEVATITIPGGNVLVPINPQDITGSLGSTPIFGNTQHYIINFTTTASITISNPSSETQPFYYSLFKLNNSCNNIDIYINPPSSHSWEVSLDYTETANTTMENYQAICFWFAWDKNNEYSYKITNGCTGEDTTISYTKTPEIFDLTDVNSTEILNPVSGTMEIIYKTGFRDVGGVAEFSLSSTSNSINSLHPTSINSLCAGDLCKWNDYSDHKTWVIPKKPSNTTQIVVIVFAIIFGICGFIAWRCYRKRRADYYNTSDNYV
ncbi:hypothetical protein GPJ56_005196 [Histomonas meleagridis]|uniref:uncharacterized protein n=1 Tax=Histomonas meleagridis TaxID=135588 RepID=UPI0035594800|nr:hypothetical protein GPJ56_005196 [Histomonas meleagridis]KAH0802712.1 hypothetical protein GO595_004761 [Histomonas meleagridis]